MLVHIRNIHVDSPNIVALVPGIKINTSITRSYLEFHLLHIVIEQRAKNVPGKL